MKQFSNKLIVLRGNSGSGKSTVACGVRELAKGKIALIEQDYLRRVVLKEKETEGTANIGLIKQTVEYALTHGYDVILEGILYFPRYGEMLAELAAQCPYNYFYYFDISYEETVRRHYTKPNSHEFGEEQLREWYKPNQQTGFKSETIIPEGMSANEAVQLILTKSGLPLK